MLVQQYLLIMTRCLCTINIFLLLCNRFMLRHRFVSNFSLEGTQRTRRYIIPRAWGACANRGAIYRHRKPPKMALFCGVPIPEKREQAFAFCCFAGHFVCCKHTSNSDARSALHKSSATTTKKPANKQSETSGVKA